MQENNVNNKLLDEFLGSEGEYISHKDIWGGEVWGSYEPHKYNSDWNRLMEVVDKIEDIGNFVEISCKSCIIKAKGISENIYIIQFDIDRVNLSKLDIVYKACVDFVKWYNENK